MQKTPYTVQGAARMREELERLKRVRRPEIVRAISEARAHGDLKENAEYHAAREQQGLNEARIRDLEAKLAHAHIIDITKIAPSGKVIFGTTVDLINLETDERVCYQIVGEDEADVAECKISVHAPIARALIGKNEGDVVSVSAPKGEIEYEIVTVRHV